MIQSFKQHSMKLTVFGLFFLSGACGLIYQVAWTRIITHVFGTTVFAVSIVLTAFMSGLALGSYFLGRRGDESKNPLRLYAFFEVGIGLTALGTLLLLDRLNPFYLWLHGTMGTSPVTFNVARFVAAFLILIVPTILMGATLPILSRFVITRLGNLGRSLGTLYALNTFGAVAGSLAAGFFLIRHLGVHATVHLAVGLNLAVGFLAFALSWWKRQPRTTAEPEKNQGPATAPSNRHRALLFAFALSGFTSFAYEIYWTRSLVFLMGNSTYAFVTMLTAFLLGIALGGYLIRFLIDRLQSPLRAFAWAEVFIGLSAALAMPLLITVVYSDTTAELFQSYQQQLGFFLLIRFGFSLLVMLIPTLLIGATFPLIGKIVIYDLNRASSDVGKIYAVNTLGNILGAFIPGLILLPLLGIGKGVFLMAVLNIAIGAVILLGRRKGVSATKLACTAIGLGCVTFLSWQTVDFQFPSNNQNQDDRVLFYKEGISGTVKVYQNPRTGVKSISVDGVNIGGTAFVINHKQQVLAHMPSLLASGLERELSIGLGSGILIGECTKHQEISRITCLELSPTVVEGAAHFEEDNHGVLHDPRVEVIVNDGVNYLSITEDTYDIISSDAKSHPEHGGNGVFFTEEYYHLMREHLSSRGLAIQWVPIHYPLKSYLTIIKTFTEVFPEASLWFFPPVNSFLIGSNHPLQVDFTRMNEILKTPACEEFSRFGIKSATDLLCHCVSTGDRLKKVCKNAEINNFEYPRIEFYSMADFAVPVAQRTQKIFNFIQSLRDKKYGGPNLVNINEKDRAHLSRAFDSMGAYLNGQELLSAGKSGFQRLFQQALSLDPENAAVRFYSASHHQSNAQAQFRQGNLLGAEKSIHEALALHDKSPKAHYLHGAILAQKGQFQTAVEALERSLSLEPRRPQTIDQLGWVLFQQGKKDEAREVIEAGGDYYLGQPQFEERRRIILGIG